MTDGREQDGPSPLHEILRPASTAVMVIDVQNDFCDATQFPGTAAMLPALKQFLSGVRSTGLPIIFVRAIHSDRTDSPVWLSRGALLASGRDLCREGSYGAEFHPEIRPTDEDIVITKNRYSAFLGTDLEMVLRARRIDSLVFTGVATNVCVEATAREAFQRDYWTTLVSDCLAARSAERHRDSLKEAERLFGRVATSAEVLEALRQGKALRRDLTPRGGFPAGRRG